MKQELLFSMKPRANACSAIYSFAVSVEDFEESFSPDPQQVRWKLFVINASSLTQMYWKIRERRRFEVHLEDGSIQFQE